MLNFSEQDFCPNPGHDGILVISSENVHQLSGFSGLINQAAELVRNRLKTANDFDEGKEGIQIFLQSGAHVVMAFEEGRVVAVVTVAPHFNKDDPDRQPFIYEISNLAKAREAKVTSRELILKCLKIVPDNVNYILACVDTEDLTKTGAKKIMAKLKGYMDMGFSEYCYKNEEEKRKWERIHKIPLIVHKSRLLFNLKVRRGVNKDE